MIDSRTGGNPVAATQTGEDLLTLQEVADHLRVTRRTVTNLVNRGDLPVVRVAIRAPRVRRSDLASYVFSRTVAR